MRLHDDTIPIIVISFICAAVAYFFTTARHTFVGLIRSIIAGLLVGTPTGLYMLGSGYPTETVLAVTIVSAMFADYALTGCLKLAKQFATNPSKCIDMFTGWWKK